MALAIKYEITPQDYADANSTLAGRQLRITDWNVWTFWGAAALLLLLPLSYRRGAAEWDYPFLVVPFAAFLIYYGFLFLIPGLNARQWYRHTGLKSRLFTAEFSAHEVRVAGENVIWLHQWPSFQLIKESGKVFVFYDGIMMYIFAKRYFTEDQAVALRRLIAENWRPHGAKVDSSATGTTDLQ